MVYSPMPPTLVSRSCHTPEIAVRPSTQAAIGCAQLDKLDGFTAARKRNFERLHDGLRELPELALFERYPESDPSWFGFLIRLTPRAGFTRNELAEHLESRGIQTRNLFAGNLTRHPCFETLREGCDYRVAGRLANTDELMNNAFWIGLYPGMTGAKLDFMIETIRNYCGGKSL